MSVWLEAALALAGLAFAVLVAALLPAIRQLRRNAEQLTATVETLSVEVASLAQESRATLDQIHTLAQGAQDQWRHVERAVDTVRGWTDRADAVVQEVDAAISPPLLQTARAIGVARAGVTAFVQTLRRRDGSPAPSAAAPRTDGREPDADPAAPEGAEGS